MAVLVNLIGDLMDVPGPGWKMLRKEGGDGLRKNTYLFLGVFIFQRSRNRNLDPLIVISSFWVFISRIKVDLTTVGELKKGNRRRDEQNFSKDVSKKKWLKNGLWVYY